MGQIKSIPMTIAQCSENMANGMERELLQDILELFTSRGFTYLVSATNPDRIYCYVKKSRETLIINKKTYVDRLADNGFSVQIRITSPKSFETLNALSDNVRGCIVNGRDCKSPHCCNCGHEYRFVYGDKPYRKCHMLCDNFMLHHLSPSDKDSVLSLIENEIAELSRKRK